MLFWLSLSLCKIFKMDLHEMGIPSVDLADFIHGNMQQKAAFVQSLGQAYENIGFVAVKNHLIDEPTTNELYQEVKSFFELPLETKLK
jgi:isopenicillin N synthase-like dioxygenase